jgi:hypothetical protein
MEQGSQETPESRPDYADDGVDTTLIRWMLEMTPAERLAVLQSFVDSVWKARGADEEG